MHFGDSTTFFFFFVSEEFSIIDHERRSIIQAQIDQPNEAPDGPE